MILPSSDQSAVAQTRSAIRGAAGPEHTQPAVSYLILCPGSLIVVHKRALTCNLTLILNLSPYTYWRLATPCVGLLL